MSQLAISLRMLVYIQIQSFKQKGDTYEKSDIIFHFN